MFFFCIVLENENMKSFLMKKKIMKSFWLCLILIFFLNRENGNLQFLWNYTFYGYIFVYICLAVWVYRIKIPVQV